MDLLMHGAASDQTPGIDGHSVLRIVCFRVLVRTIVLVAAAALVSGCSEIEYYWQGIAGQTDLLARAKPITEVIATTSDTALKNRLARAQEIRAFASQELALPDNRSYTSYADLGRPYAVWNVFAAPELSLTPRQWCFPVAGCVNYRGYFSEADARAEAARLAAAGDDVHMSGIPAYSTLGYFDDPVLSTFVNWPDTDLAGLIFHELAHGRVFVPGDTPFNEAFASFVERRGVVEWLLATQDQALIDATQARWKTSDRFVAYLLEWRDELQRLYDQPYNTFALRVLKTELLTAMETCYRTNADRFGDQDWYFASGRLNNARFVPLAAYNELRESFETLFAQSGESWPQFYSKVAEIGGLNSEARTEAMKSLGDAYRLDHPSESADLSCAALVF